MIFGMWNPEKIAHEQLIDFLTSPVRVLFWDTLCRPKPYTVVSKLKATGKCNFMVHKVRRGRCWYLVSRQTAREWCKSCTYVDSRRRLPVLSAHSAWLAVTFPAAEHHCLLAGDHCAYPRRDGQAELARLAWLHTEMEYPPWRRSTIQRLTGTDVEQSSFVDRYTTAPRGLTKMHDLKMSDHLKHWRGGCEMWKCRPENDGPSRMAWKRRTIFVTLSGPSFSGLAFSGRAFSAPRATPPHNVYSD